jgi:two-component system response regulator AtoC
MGLPAGRGRKSQSSLSYSYIMTYHNTSCREEAHAWPAICFKSGWYPMAIGLTRAIHLLGESGFVYGESPAIQAVNAVVGEMARTDIPVLLIGESGTGKDIYGKLIHELSRQRELPMAKLNCTMLAPAELLNQMKQTFARAEEGNAGTLFLDGIDELDLDCQKVMLATLQQQEVARQPQPILRIISTATRPLDKETAIGRFRRELYFRINGVCVKLPALRDRKPDIVPLAEHFLEKHARETGKRTPGLNVADEELLVAHDWPGNVRELENLSRRIVALGESRSVLGELQPATDRLTAGIVSRNASLKAVAREASRLAERDLILKALEKTHWNRKQAAKQLQISYKALLYKIKQMEVPGAELKSEGEER